MKTSAQSPGEAKLHSPVLLNLPPIPFSATQVGCIFFNFSDKTTSEFQIPAKIFLYCLACFFVTFIYISCFNTGEEATVFFWLYSPSPPPCNHFISMYNVHFLYCLPAIKYNYSQILTPADVYKI